MKKLRIWATVSLTLGILALVVLLVSVAALTDIYHGEEDAQLEWLFVRLAFLVIFFLIVATIICTTLVLKHFRDLDKTQNK
jgi:predicted membrane channel-forming protein YqfA (hemolysin III family)